MKVVIEFEMELIGDGHDMPELSEALRDAVSVAVASQAVRISQPRVGFMYMDV